MLNEGTSIQPTICVSVRLVEGEHERPIRSFYGLQTLFCVTDMIFQSLPACQNTYHTCKNEDIKCVSSLDLWNGWWANQLICNLMCFIKRKKGSGSVIRDFSSVCFASGRDLFSALVLVLSVVLLKGNLSCVLFHITSRSENVFMVLNIKVPLDFMSIWCILSDTDWHNNMWRQIKDKHVACVLLFIFTDFQLRSKV